ncbi:hypothetical protein EC968_009420, partial [Mortierella alpina]
MSAAKTQPKKAAKACAADVITHLSPLPSSYLIYKPAKRTRIRTHRARIQEQS